MRLMPLCLAAVFLLLAMACAVSAQDEPALFEFRLDAGGRFDSGIIIPELDLATRQDDLSATLAAGLLVRPVANDSFTLELSADYDRRDYADVAPFDRENIRLSVFADYVVSDKLGFSLTYDFHDQQLGGEGLLQRHSFRPSVGLSIGDNGYFIGSATYEDRDFDLVDSRDGDRWGIDADYYYFLRYGTTLSVGVGYQQEDTRADRFDYKGFLLRLSAEQPLRLWDQPTTIAVSYLLDHRDYAGIDLFIGADRDDSRHQFDVSVEMEFGRRFYTRLGYQWEKIDSNFIVTDGTNHQVLLRAGIKF